MHNELCPKCGCYRVLDAVDCYKCGIVFHKFRSKGQSTPTEGPVAVMDAAPIQRTDGILHTHIVPIPDGLNWILWTWRLGVLSLLVAGTLYFSQMPIHDGSISRSFLHGVNLAFHEAGHVLFRPLGQFMTTLGGSLAQLLVPLACFLFFFIQHRNAMGSAFAFWWFGQNFVDLAPYIHDARSQTLMLVGGVTGSDVPGYHDWNTILGQLGLLDWDIALGRFSFGLGLLLMVIGTLWGAACVYTQFREIRRRAQADAL